MSASQLLNAPTY